MLRIENVNVSYGSIHALHDISLTVNDGEVVSLIGANGAGKSTMLNAVAGVWPIAQHGPHAISRIRTPAASSISM